MPQADVSGTKPRRSLPPDRLPLISLSIPVLNEDGNIARLYERLTKLADEMKSRCDLEFVFSDNRSSDKTWSMLEDISVSDQRVRAIRFSRNVGFQRSILANYMHTKGDAVMQLDADLQDPPELLERFFDLWLQGYDVVYGIRRMRPESALLRWIRGVGYYLVNAASEHDIPRNAGDFRLVDRKVINALMAFRTPNPYLRGMIAGLGFEQIGLEYDRDARMSGSSKFGIPRLLRLGLTAVLNHSTIPLRLASLLGMAIVAVSIIGTLYYMILRLVRPDLPQGLASIHILVLFGIGLQSTLLGIIGEYLLRIYVILRGEPLAIVDRYLNYSHDELKL